MEQNLVKKQVIELLESSNRIGIKELIAWLEKEGFFESPASTKFHGNYPGGLAEHSLNLYHLFIKSIRDYGISVPSDSVIIATLLHDVCKVGLYKGEKGFYSYDSSVINQGHAKLSLQRIKQFIQLTDIEERFIKYHMGMYGAGERNPEYSIQELWSVFSDSKVKLFYFCDDMVSQFIDVQK